LANLVIDKTNTLLHLRNGNESEAVLVGLDGWHFTRAQLDAFPDPKLAHDKRGSHWTFDAHSYVNFIRSLRQVPIGDSIIKAPTFDHSLKDPTPDAISIHPHHRIILIEGLYTCLTMLPWLEAAEALDERWFLDVKLEETHRRLTKRHIVTGVAKSFDEAIWRSNENDTPSSSLRYFLKRN
jgi:pantothenate kinase